ncbi:hypothetical protein B296_00050727 [Ensete ventricosum]|uniref:Uncharacterized protein n=1 Tax=Ensete ventricosum TaxID=4639 RepID=A0A426YAT8_ENSVE|nr:hypothetical protein B296_00050727 [Ensete ventricosum]
MTAPVISLSVGFIWSHGSLSLIMGADQINTANLDPCGPQNLGTPDIAMWASVPQASVVGGAFVVRSFSEWVRCFICKPKSESDKCLSRAPA